MMTSIPTCLCAGFAVQNQDGTCEADITNVPSGCRYAIKDTTGAYKCIMSNRSDDQFWFTGNANWSAKDWTTGASEGLTTTGETTITGAVTQLTEFVIAGDAKAACDTTDCEAGCFNSHADSCIAYKSSTKNNYMTIVDRHIADEAALKAAGTFRAGCRPNTVFVSGTGCVDCPVGCSTCTSAATPTDCTACFEGYHLFGTDCIFVGSNVIEGTPANVSTYFF
jgi:hypothetical protein